MSKMLKNSGKVNINDNIVMGLVMPLIIYYVIHNAWVIGGLAVLELAVNSGKFWSWDEETLFLVQTFIKISGMMIGGLSVYPYFKRQRTMEMKKSLSRKEGVALIFIGMVLALGLNYIFLLTGLPQNNEQYQQVAEVQFALPLWLAFLFYGIISPVVEEMVFRGIACSRLEQHMSPMVAVAGSALLFGAFHGNLIQMLYASIMGVVLALVYRKYRNLTAPVLLHGAANVVVYFITYFF